MQIHGQIDDAFSPVRDAFAKNFADGREAGASVAVTQHGKPVVDIWAGHATAETGPNSAPWAEDTIVNVWSTTKTMAAVCMLMLSDRGQLDFNAPVADYWPEFAQNGKEGVLVRHVMSHSAGLSDFDPPLSAHQQLYDRRTLAQSIAPYAAVGLDWWVETAFDFETLDQLVQRGPPA